MSQNKSTIGMRYGKALYELANEKNIVSNVLEDLQALKLIFDENPTLGEVLTDIRLDMEQKASLMKELKEGAHDVTQNFLSVVFESKRMDVLPFMIEDFISRYNEENGIIHGTVTTAVPLTENQKNEIANGLKKRLNIQNVTLSEKVNEKIIAGVIVEANGQIIDGSVRSQLTKLKSLMKQV